MLERFSNLVKKVIKLLIPEVMLRQRSRMILKRLRDSNALRPIEDVFAEIYAKNSWGGPLGEYWSGSGSVGIVADEYCKMVAQLIVDKEIQSVVDIGCGDFRIGARIAPLVDSYLGIDIVPDLIRVNTEKFGSKSVRFLCADVSDSAPLPAADLCLIRQVFQHLSNSEILAILAKLAVYKFVLVTEHFPKVSSTFSANRDKPHGLDTRVYDGSAVLLSAPPFNVSPLELCLEVYPSEVLVEKGESIRSYLFRGEAASAQVGKVSLVG